MIKEIQKKYQKRYPSLINEINEILGDVEQYYKDNSKRHYNKNRKKIIERASRNRDLKFFGGKREFILERDNFQCQECGMNNEQHLVIFGKSLTIHHIDGNGSSSKTPNNNKENLITLCLRCHGKKDSVTGRREVKNGK